MAHVTYSAVCFDFCIETNGLFWISYIQFLGVTVILFVVEAFSLFSVVQFENEPCLTKIAGSTTYGTCLTSTECGDRGGSNQGKCASGFGICCFFK